MSQTRQKVLVGMSGGVDSSLAAALLVEAGHNVTGVFLKVWSEEEFLGLSTLDFRLSTTATYDSRYTKVGLSCPWQDDLRDAQAVADQLGIELVVRNVQREYWDRVVAEFIAGYRQGLTPNPDILCNSEIKFGLLYDWAMAEGFDAMATGHYARLSTIDSGLSNPTKVDSRDTKVEVHRARDERKDQTYFLWRIPRGRFAHILFPIGHLTKEEVRVQAAQRGLVTAAKRDSQGICFLGQVNVRDWLRRELQTEPGDVVDSAGRIIGRHAGVQLYTMGQRHGFSTIDYRLSTMAQNESRNTRVDSRPHYVVAKDLEHNRLIVSTEKPVSKALTATHLNWLDLIPKVGDQLEARIRHGQQPQPAIVLAVTRQPDHQTTNTGSLNPDEFGSLRLRFNEPQVAIAPGQSVVFSSGTHILGGGIIA